VEVSGFEPPTSAGFRGSTRCALISGGSRLYSVFSGSITISLIEADKV